MRTYDITIRGLSGWVTKGPGRVAEDPEPLPPELDTPEKRLEALKKAAAEGNIEFAPDERGGFVVQWSEPSIGFGELYVHMKEDGSVEIDDECMSREFVEAVLMALLKKGATRSEKAERS